MNNTFRSTFDTIKKYLDEEKKKIPFLKKTNKKKKIFSQLFSYPYYYVPQCPNCRSFVTGRYLSKHRATEREWIERDSLQKGEIIQFKDVSDEKNCFCLDCGHEWSAYIPLQFISYSQREAEKAKRHTEEFLGPLMDKLEEEKKARPFISIGGFVGKL